MNGWCPCIQSPAEWMELVRPSSLTVWVCGGEGTSARAGREPAVVLCSGGSGRPAEGKERCWSQFSSCCCITDQIGARRWNHNQTLLPGFDPVVETDLFLLWKLQPSNIVWTYTYRRSPSIKKVNSKVDLQCIYCSPLFRHSEGSSAEILATWSQCNCKSLKRSLNVQNSPSRCCQKGTFLSSHWCRGLDSTHWLQISRLWCHKEHWHLSQVPGRLPLSFRRVKGPQQGISFSRRIQTEG